MRYVSILAFVVVMFAIPNIVMSSQHERIVLKAIYTPAEGADPEHGQGAIERCDLPHREIRRFIWLVLVDAPSSPDEWQERLNRALDRKHGSFRVVLPSPEEEEMVRSGKIEFQR